MENQTNNSVVTDQSLANSNLNSNDALYHSLAFTIISFISFLSNTIVILVMIKYKSLRKIHSNKFLFNLLSSGSFVSIVLIVYSVYVIINIKQGTTMVEFYNKNAYFAVLVDSVLILSLISLIFISTDRLVAVKYPFFYQDNLRTKRVYIIISVSWISAFLFFIILVAIVETQGKQIAIKTSNFFSIVVTMVGFCVLLLSTSLIYKETSRHLEAMSKLSTNEKDKTAIFKERQCRLFRVNFRMVALFVTFWLFPLVFTFLNEINGTTDIRLGLTSFYCVHLYYIFNPILYIATSRDVKMKLKSLYGHKRRIESDFTKNSTLTTTDRT